VKIELIHLFQPRPDESPLGYYRRLAAANALWSWKDLALMVGVTPSRSGLLGTPDHVAEALGIEASWTRQLAQQEQRLRALRSLHRSRGDAVCTHCLVEDMYLRAHWEHAYMTACPRHRVRLVDRCSSCGEHLQVHRERIDHCRCGMPIAESRSETASDAQLWLSSLIASAGADSLRVEPNVAGVELSDLVHLVRVFCQWFDFEAAPARRNASGPGSIAEAVEFLKPLELLLNDWPQAYTSHVSARIAAGPEQARTLKARLGYWYQQLYAVAREGPLKVFLAPVIAVANQEFDGAIAMNDGARWEDLGYVRLKDAARTFPVGIGALRRAVAANQLSHRAVRYGTKGKVYQVLRTDVERMVQARAGWISEVDACKRLGVGSKVLSNMAMAGLLEADLDWSRDAMKGGPVRIGTVEALAAKLLGQQADAPAAGERVSFRDLTSRRLGDNTAIQNLMRAIHSGAVLAQGPAAEVGALEYTLSEVRSFFGTPLLEAGLSVNQLNKLTGWKNESVKHWMEAGLLESFAITLRGQPCRVVMPSQLLDFTRNYLPVADMARLVSGKPSSLAKHFAQVGVIGGHIDAKGVQRGALLKMTDVARLAVAAVRNGSPKEPS